jgi:predicted transcriptional regulator
MNASEIMLPDPPVCHAGTSLAEAARTMLQAKIEAVPVIAPENRRLAGLITIWELLRAVADGAAPNDACVAEYARTDVITVEPAQVLEQLGLTGLGPAAWPGDGCPIVVVDPEQRVVGLIPRPEVAIRTAELEQGQEPDPLSFRSDSMQLLWICTRCGYWQSRNQPLPEQCPQCQAPREEFVLHTEQ